jgi:ATP-binding cassette subfamily B protein
MIHNKISSKVFLELARFVKPYKSQAAVVLLALFATAIMILFFGKAIKYLIDFGFAEKNNFHLTITLIVFSTASIVMSIAGYYRSYLTHSIAEKIIADIRKEVYQKLVKISPEFFEMAKTGDIISRLTVSTSAIYDFISNMVSFFLRNSLLFVGGICFLFLTSVKLTLVSLTVIPIAISPIILMLKNVRIFANQSQAALSQVSSHIEETISGIKTIQSYSCEEREIKNFSSFIDKFLVVVLQKNQLRSMMVALVLALSFVGISIVLFVGGRAVINGEMTSGDLSSFIFYSITVATSLVGISQIAGQMQNVIVSISRIMDLLKLESPVQEQKNPTKFHQIKTAKIEFKGVDFSYKSRKDSLVLKNFNLEINPKEKIAITGVSGSGKSTILKLLLRFYDPNSGEIKINDRDIKSISLSDLRQNFSYISQNCFIFSGTIFDNISYLSQSVSRSDALSIIEKNEALHFIKNMPDGIDTVVGEKGVKLSGGERQRIAIARAIIKDSAILLLDEATSALDNQNEHLVIKTIEDFTRDKTVITIAHKLSSIILANRVIFIKDGFVAEVGTHEELILKGGLYKKMYEDET